MRKALCAVEVILQQGKQDKVKQTYYIEEGTSLLLDELRLQLPRESDLPLSKTSEPAIAQVALELQAKNISRLAARVGEGGVHKFELFGSQASQLLVSPFQHYIEIGVHYRFQRVTQS